MNVAHFIRKKGQLKASFINNQISNHISFKPYIIFKYSNQSGGFVDIKDKNFDFLDLSKENNINIDFKNLKKISSRDYKKILNFLDYNRIDINHFHYGSDAFIYSEILKNSTRPSVVSFYGYDCSAYPSSFFGYGKKCLNKNVFKYATKILAMSQDMKKDLIDIGCQDDKIIVHYHGIDTSKFNFKREYINKDKINLLILSNLVPKKGHIFLLNSIKEIIKNNIFNFQLRIVGEGLLEKELKKFVNDNQLSDFTTFVGSVRYNSKEMHEEYRNADIFLHPSVISESGDKEGIPGTIVEAMSSGLPVVSTYHAGIPYIIENGKTGLLVKEHSTDGLAQAILSLINSVELRKRIGTAGQEYAINNLDLKVKEKELENIYMDLINKKTMLNNSTILVI